MKGYTQKEVSQILDIKFQTIASYASQDIIIPEISNPRGKGSTRIYSKKNLIEIQFAKALSNIGIPQREIKIFLENKILDFNYCLITQYKNTNEHRVNFVFAIFEYLVGECDFYSIINIDNLRNNIKHLK